MSKHTALINKLWQGDADRKTARAFVEKFGGVPGMDDRIPAMLQETAATADRIAAGEVSLNDGAPISRASHRKDLGSLRT